MKRVIETIVRAEFDVPESMTDEELTQYLATAVVLDVDVESHGLPAGSQLDSIEIDWGRVEVWGVPEADMVRVIWKPEDVLTLCPDWTYEQAAEWLADHRNQIQDRSIERGWEVIEALL